MSVLRFLVNARKNAVDEFAARRRTVRLDQIDDFAYGDRRGYGRVFYLVAGKQQRREIGLENTFVSEIVKIADDDRFEFFFVGGNSPTTSRIYALSSSDKDGSAYIDAASDSSASSVA